MDIKRRGKNVAPYTLDRGAFDDYEKRQLRQSRTATLQRIISEAEAALNRAEDAPQSKKDALRKRIDELKGLMDRHWADDEAEQPKTPSEDGSGDSKGEAGKEASNDERRHGNGEADDGQNDSRGGAKADGSDEDGGEADSENGEYGRSRGKASEKGENGKDDHDGQDGENSQGEASNKGQAEEDGNDENGDESGSDREKSSGKSSSSSSRDKSFSNKSRKNGEQKPDYSRVTQHSSESGSTNDERWGQNSGSGGNQNQSQDQSQDGSQSHGGEQSQNGKDAQSGNSDSGQNGSEDASDDKNSSGKDSSDSQKGKSKPKDDDTPQVQWADDGSDGDEGADDDGDSSPKIIVHRRGDRPSQGGSGGEGGENDIHIGEPPEMGGMPDAGGMGGGAPTPPKKLTVDQIVNLIKPLKGADRANAEKALSDKLAALGNGDSSLGEALRPIPNKVLTDFTDDEFSDMVNDVIDEMEELAGPLGVEDPGEKQARIDKIAQDLDNGSLIRELEDEDKAIVARDKQKKAAMVKAREKELNKYKNFKPISQFYIDFYRTVKDQVSIEEIDDPTMARINTRYEGSGIIKPGVRRVEERGDEIPAIDFYFDMSGSWTSDKEAIDVGKRAVRQIKEFHDKGEIKLNVFYFSSEVVNDMNSSDLGGGTYAWEKILDNIKATGAKNVVLMTDSDMADQARSSEGLTIDGHV